MCGAGRGRIAVIIFASCLPPAPATRAGSASAHGDASRAADARRSGPACRRRGAPARAGRRTPRRALVAAGAAASRPAAARAALLALAWLLVAPRTPDLAAAGVSREPVPPRRLRGVGRALVRRPLPARLQPAVPAARRRCSASAALGVDRGARLERAVRADRRRARTARGARWGRVLFALAAAGDIWIGRVTFALGVTFALAAVLALMRTRAAARGVLSRCCAPPRAPWRGCCSRSPRSRHALASARCGRSLVLALPPAAGARARCAVPRGRLGAVPAALVHRDARSWCSRSCGRSRARSGCCESAASCTCSCACCASWCTRRWAATWSATGCCSRARCCCAVLSGRDPRGRLARREPDRARSRWAWRLRRAPSGCCGAPCARRGAVAGSAATQRLLLRAPRALPAGLPRGPVRVEVPLTRSHWEAALLAPSVSLARGWEKQLETRYDQRPALARAERRLVSAMAALAGGRLRGAAGRPARRLERAGGSADRARACRTCAKRSAAPTGGSSAVLGAHAAALGPGQADSARPRRVRARGATVPAASSCACATRRTGRSRAERGACRGAGRMDRGAAAGCRPRARGGALLAGSRPRLGRHLRRAPS